MYLPEYSKKARHLFAALQAWKLVVAMLGTCAASLALLFPHPYKSPVVWTVIAVLTGGTLGCLIPMWRAFLRFIRVGWKERLAQGR